MVCSGGAAGREQQDSKIRNAVQMHARDSILIMHG